MTKNGKCVKISISIEQDNKTNLNCYYAVKGSTKMEESVQFNSATQGLDLYICLAEDEPKDCYFTSLVLAKTAVHKEQNKTKMIELHTNLREVTNYLIQLFYKTGKIYSCTQTKLGKLLSILAFKYAQNDEKLFDETIYKYPPRCGTLIKDLAFIGNKNVYKRDITQDDLDNCQIITHEFDHTVDIPLLYNEIASLSDELKKDIESVFRSFGAFPASILGEILNPIVDLVVNDIGEIELTKFKDLQKNSFDKTNSNIVEYIYQQ